MTALLVTIAVLLALAPWTLLLRSMHAPPARRSYDGVCMGDHTGRLFEIVEPPFWKPWRHRRWSRSARVLLTFAGYSGEVITVRIVDRSWSHPRVPSPAARPPRRS